MITCIHIFPNLISVVFFSFFLLPHFFQVISVASSMWDVRCACGRLWHDFVVMSTERPASRRTSVLSRTRKQPMENQMPLINTLYLCQTNPPPCLWARSCSYLRREALALRHGTTATVLYRRRGSYRFKPQNSKAPAPRSLPQSHLRWQTATTSTAMAKANRWRGHFRMLIVYSCRKRSSAKEKPRHYVGKLTQQKHTTGYQLTLVYQTS